MLPQSFHNPQRGVPLPLSSDAAKAAEAHNAEKNPAYSIFDRIGANKPNKIKRLSVTYRDDPQVHSQGQDGVAAATFGVHTDSNFVASQAISDKIRRLQEMRKIALFPEVSDCLDEICDEGVTPDDTTEKLMMFKLKGDHNGEIMTQLEKEFYEFLEVYDLDQKGWEYFRQFLIEGELFFENVISPTQPELGIIGVISLPAELIDPIYYNVQNGEIETFRLRKITTVQTAPQANARNLYQQTAATLTNNTIDDIVLMKPNQITYIQSGRWNEDKTVRLPHLDLARGPYKKLSLVEDAIVIYRLVRAPERLKFNIDVGNMSPAMADAHVKKMSQAFWQRKALDANGQITNAYNPQTSLDSFWFPKRNGTEGSDVSVLPGGMNLGQLEDLNYFIEKLYRSLKVPLSRLTSDAAVRDGSDITREELRFSKFVQRIQHQFVSGIRDSFITHLKLRGKNLNDEESKSWWEQFELSSSDIVITMASPTNFAQIKENQLLELRQNSFNNAVSNELFSTTFGMRHLLKMTDEEIKQNTALLRFDAGIKWQLDRITEHGPNYREAIKQQYEELTGGAEVEAMGGLGGGPGGGSGLPDFGDMGDEGGDEGGNDASGESGLPDSGSPPADTGGGLPD